MTVTGPFSTSSSNQITFGNYGTVLLDGAGKKITIGTVSHVATNLNSGLFQVTNGATLDLYSFQNTTAGVITASGGSTVNLYETTGSNSISNEGTINLDGSTLVIGRVPYASGSFTTVTTANLGTIHATGASTVRIVTNVNNTGATLSLDSSTGSFELDGGRLGGGHLVTTPSAPLVAHQGSSIESLTIDGYVEIDGGVLVNAVTLTSGAIHLNGGHLGDQLFGIGAFNLQAGGSITGNGTIHMSPGPVLLAGTISPGNSLGTITVQGAATPSSGFHLAMELGASGMSDHFNVTGALDLSAADDYLDLSSLPGTVTNSPYTIATAASITGTFDHATPGYDVQYTGTSVIITPLPEPAALVGIAIVAVQGLFRRRHHRSATNGGNASYPSCN